MNYGFIIDNRKCIGCHACTVACKSEHDVAIGVNRTWVKYVEKGEYPNTRRLFSVMRCNHCEDAPCVEICPVEALHIRDDGIVDFDNRRCIGCKSCMQACPYNALYIDPVTHTAAKCNYCAHRIDIGLEPACVNVCPEHAIISGDMDNPATEIAQLLSREAVKVRKPEKGTRPKLFYIDADEASLTPSETETSDSYMWSSQSSGVGHYAKYAEGLIAKNSPVDMYKELARLKEMPEKVIIGGDNTIQKPDGILKRTIRRAYDAPSKGVLWGWEVSAYVMTKAIAAGAVLLPFLALLFGVPVGDSLLYGSLISGLIFLGLTGALLVKDLDKPTRFAYVILRPQWNSWLVRGGYAITVFGGLVTLWLAARFLGLSALEPIAMWGSGLFALVVAVYTAFLFAQAKGRDFWQSPALILHMLAHPFVGGGALFALAAPFTASAGDWNGFIHTVLIGALAVNLLILFAELTITHPTVDAKKAAHMITAGSYAPLFWLGSIILGNILPLLILLWSPAWMVSVAAVLILAGLYITEHLWVRVPQLINLS